MQGTPSGEAFIQMDSEKSAESTALTKNKKLMFVGGNRRYVDVIQCSGDEMAVVLQQGLPAPAPAPLSSVPQPSAPVHGAAAPAGVLPTGFWSLPPPTAPTTDLTLLLQQRNTIPLPSVPGIFISSGIFRAVRWCDPLWSDCEFLDNFWIIFVLFLCASFRD